MNKYIKSCFFLFLNTLSNLITVKFNVFFLTDLAFSKRSTICLYIGSLRK